MLRKILAVVIIILAARFALGSLVLTCSPKLERLAESHDLPLEVGQGITLIYVAIGLIVVYFAAKLLRR